ncbi:MAG: hypothetical protein ABI599_00990 [Flavobacteriales bacterium]
MASTLRACPQGHRYHKSSACPTCPICEQDKSLPGFPKMSAPARRALENAGIRTLKQLAKKSEAGIMALHGMGPSTLPKLRAALKAEGLSFKK